jgi:hypothetical protein
MNSQYLIWPLLNEISTKTNHRVTFALLWHFTVWAVETNNVIVRDEIWKAIVAFSQQRFLAESRRWRFTEFHVARLQVDGVSSEVCSSRL